MGIFDVFSSKKTSTSSVQGDDGAQSTVPQPKLSDVKYPIPTSDNPESLSNDLSTQFSQFAKDFDPNADPLDITNSDPIQSLNPSANVVQPEIVAAQPGVNNTPAETINNLSDDFSNFQQQQSVVPETIQSEQTIDQKGVEVPPIQTEVSTPEIPVVLNSESTQMPVVPEMSQPQPATNLNEPIVEPLPQPTVPTMEPEIQLPSSNPFAPVNAVPEVDLSSQIQNTTVQNGNSPMNDTIEFGVSAPQTEVQPTMQAETQPITPEFTLDSIKTEEPETNKLEENPINATAGDQFSSMIEPQTINISSVQPEQITDVTPAEIPTVDSQIVNSAMTDSIEPVAADISAEELPTGDTDILGNPLDSQMSEDTIEPPTEEITNQNFITQSYESEDTSKIGKINIVNIKKLGFIGLNSKETDEGIKMDLTELSESIGLMIEEYVLDSSTGYATDLLKGLTNKDLTVKSFLLKSSFSLFTQEPFNMNNFTNFTNYIFSDSLERLKNIIAESDAIVLVYSSGLSNLSSYFTVMNIASIYKEMGKPFILLGSRWDELLNNMVSTNILAQADISNFLIANEANELLAHLQTIDNNFAKTSNSTKESKLKIVDLRKEDDELAYLSN